MGQLEGLRGSRDRGRVDCQGYAPSRPKRESVFLGINTAPICNWTYLCRKIRCHLVRTGGQKGLFEVRWRGTIFRVGLHSETGGQRGYKRWD